MTDKLITHNQPDNSPKIHRKEVHLSTLHLSTTA